MSNGRNSFSRVGLEPIEHPVDLELRTARMLEIAEDLAERHSREVHSNHSAASARADTFLDSLGESFEAGRGLLEEVLSEAETDELNKRLCDFLRLHADRFEARLERGRFVRRPREAFGIHIDIGVIESEVGRDCLDIDIAWDLAAIATELDALGRVDLAETLLWAYARHSDDYDLYGVIDFYKGLYALDYALDLLQGATRAAGSRDRTESLEEDARRMLLVALAAERRPLVQPQVIAMSGRVASGKSTVGRHLGECISAPVVVADLVRISLLDAPAHEAQPEAVWEAEDESGLYEAVYGELLRRSEIVLASGRQVVIDACFPTREMRRRAQELAARYDAPFLFVECQAPRQVVRERLIGRAQRDSVDPSAWFDIADAYDEHHEEARELPASQRLIIDTSLSLEDNTRILYPRIVAGHRVPNPHLEERGEPALEQRVS